MVTTTANAPRTSDSICHCGKTCKNQRGLKIHQAKMKCAVVAENSQRIGVTPSKTEVEQVPVTNHSAQHHPVWTQTLPDRVVSKRIKWPPAINKKAWRDFDEDVCIIIQGTSAGNVDRRLQAMSKLIVSYGSERFGHIEKTRSKTYTQNRREGKIREVRQELRCLKKQFKASSEVERPALSELRNILREKLKNLRRAEGHRRRRKERARKRASFISNPFGFARRLLGDKRSGRLACPKDRVDSFLKSSYRDPRRDEELGFNDRLIKPNPPEVEFDTKVPSLSEVKHIVMAARSASSPGPSGVPYSVYKRCPGLLMKLWKIIKVIWQRGKVAEQWRYAEGVWIPKEENAENIEQFRCISLLSTESKIFFSVISRRLLAFLLKNSFIDTSVQKGGIPGMPGCVEHIGVLSQLIRDARKNKGDLAVAWLDLANAYGSIPHKLVEEALVRHYVPSSIRELIQDYYRQFHLRVASGLVSSDWHRLERGIITGCTLSATLFALAMNMLVKSAEVECRGPVSNTGVRQPPIRAYMDDLTVTTHSVTGCRWLLRGLERLIEWARMKFKPNKCRSVVIKKGRVVKHYFTIEGRAIPTLADKSVKSLGKSFCNALKDTPAIEAIRTDFDSWLAKIDKSGLPGRFKAWLYHHCVLPRALWPLQTYSVPISTVETLERRVSSFLRRWLGLPRCLSSAALYGSSNAIQLPFRGLVEEFMVSRTRESYHYRNSRDPKVSGAGIEIKTGRKWSATKELAVAEGNLRVKAIMGSVAQGRAGLGLIPSYKFRKSTMKERQRLIQDEVRAGMEEKRMTKMVGYSQQGAWTRWDGVDRRKVSWSDLWNTDFSRSRFLVQMVYDVLPSATNLHLWGKIDSPKCPLCSGTGSLQHILSGCRTALTDGRYRWRHDKVLEAIALIITEALQSNKLIPERRAIRFVRAGVKPSKKVAGSQSLLSSASDWQMRVDLGKQLKFPTHISSTKLRPDIIVYSDATKQIILLELTVPWEEHMQEAFERKYSKYEGLLNDCRTKGWRTRCFPVEVGCRGFAGQSMIRALTSLGITGQKRRRAIQMILESVEKATRWLWINRANAWPKTTK